MDDVAPELLEAIKRDFNSACESSEKIAALLGKIKTGTATYSDANDYAVELGDILASAYKNNITSAVLPDGQMYYNIAKRIIEPTMSDNYNLIADASVQVQKSLNEAAGIGIKAIKPELNNDRIEGIINRISSEVFENVKWLLDEPVKNFSQSVVDDSIKVNSEFHGKLGLSPKIVRKLSGGCCEWCARLAGTYTYPDVPSDVYRRHQRCRCTVDYNPGSGKVQNVHSKQWKTKDESDKIETRKTIGLETADNEVKRFIRENTIPNCNIATITSDQEVHRQGTRRYEERKAILEAKGEYGPSYLTISDEEILELVHKYSGKGKIRVDRSGKWDNKEIIITNDKIIGIVVNNKNGKTAETSVFKIHYSNRGFHIVPDYPSKRRQS